MTDSVREGTPLWHPPKSLQRHARLTDYMNWLAREYNRRFDNYNDMWEWSVSDLEGFWGSIWHFFDVQASKPYRRVLSNDAMPGAKWFEGAELNYAQHVFRGRDDSQTAIVFKSEVHSYQEISWGDLRRQVGAVAAALRKMGVRRGDRIVAYVPNIPEAVIAFLASASIGAIWSSCSPDFGIRSVIDRFRQIQPKVLLAVDGYRYGGKAYDRLEVVSELQKSLPSLKLTILVPYLHDAPVQRLHGPTISWSDLLSELAELQFEQVPFEHPLWVLYSSGTTGLPKAIVQGHGGILVEHLKVLSLHFDLGPDDRFFWYTTTGWMMWNFLVGGLLTGSTILLYDGSPTYPDPDVLWAFAEQSGMTCFGTSAAYITSCMKAGLRPGAIHDLRKLKSIGSTGSPLPAEGFQWVYQYVKPDVWLGSASGGTDVCTAFVGPNPLLPVYAGEIQCRCLGVSVEAFDEQGRSIVDQVGELVVTRPMPSMPLCFWNDPHQLRYRESYFSVYPGVWRHGDWIKVTRRGSVIIYGRSDSTLNRMGVRFGTSEIYRAVEQVPEVLDSLIVGIERPGGGYYMPLFVVLRDGVSLSEMLKERINEAIRRTLTPRHVPDDIIQAPAIPRTLNGKKLEVPVKKILMGTPVDRAVNVDSVSNPDSINFFVDFASHLKRT